MVLMKNNFSELVVNLVRVDSIWSIAIRVLVWLGLVTIFSLGAAQGKKSRQVKSEAGFFLFFIVMTGVAIYMAFGIIPTLTTVSS